MADSAIDNELNKYFSLLSPDQKESLLGMLKTFFPSANQRISIEQYNDEIDEAVNRVEKGYYTSHEDLTKESEKW